MPSKTIASSIRQSLAPGESAEDADVLFDTLLALRSELDITDRDNERVTGALLCFFFPAKPTQYREDMQRFRREFAGASGDPSKLEEFQARILPPALTLDETDLFAIEWEAKQYFALQVEAGGGEYATA